MKSSHSNNSESEEIEEIASNWTIANERGLTPEEQDAYTQWLSEDPRHGKAMAFFQWTAGELNRLAGLQTSYDAMADPDLPGARDPSQRKGHIWRFLTAKSFYGVAAVFAIALSVLFWPRQKGEDLFSSEEALSFVARIQQQRLEDGSVIELNRGARVETRITATERRVLLSSGEANFDVAKDPSRPFIVDVGKIDVRAVGTAFNVRYAEDVVDVIVTEGIVSVAPRLPEPSRELADEAPQLEVGQRAIMTLKAGKPKLEVISLTQAEQAEALLWQPRLLDFESTPLSEIVAEFNRSNPSIKLVIADPSIESLELSSSFWSDNVEGFARMLKAGFGITVEWHRQDKRIVLRKPTEARP